MGQIEEYMNTSESDLLLQLAEEIAPSGHALDLRVAAEKIKDAKEWLAANSVIFKKYICSHDVVQKSLSDKNSISKRELIAAIADAISLVTSGVTPFLIAVIIYRGGINTFCEHLEPSDD